MSYKVKMVIDGRSPLRLIYDYAILPGEEESGHKPVMSLCRVVGSTKLQYMIPLDSAFKYAKSNGYPTKYFTVGCLKAAEHLQYKLTDGGKSSELMAIKDAILDGIPDLLDMPPYERYRKEREEEHRRKTNPGENPIEVVTAKIQLPGQDATNIEIVKH